MMDILDACALLALVKDEKGGEVVKDLLVDGETHGYSIFMHQINYTEFLYRCKQLYEAEKVKSIVADLHSPFLGVVNYMDSGLAFYASHLKANYSLSLGDAIGLAYTKIMEGRFWTADKALEEIADKEKIGMKIIR